MPKLEDKLINNQELQKEVPRKLIKQIKIDLQKIEDAVEGTLNKVPSGISGALSN